jgi:hypothetical protein
VTRSERLQKTVDEFNARTKLGDRVTVRRDDGTVMITRTRSIAHLLGFHTPVIWLEGISGAYSLDRVSPIEKAPTAEKAVQS